MTLRILLGGADKDLFIDTVKSGIISKTAGDACGCGWLSIQNLPAGGKHALVQNVPPNRSAGRLLKQPPQLSAADMKFQAEMFERQIFK